MADELDKILAALSAVTDGVSALSKRMDSIEQEGKIPADGRQPGAPKEVVADSDIASGLTEVQSLKAQLRQREAAVNRAMLEARPLTAKDEAEMADFQARADSVYSDLGKSAPPPSPFERPRAYRARLLEPLKKYNKDWREVNLGGLADAVLDKIEGEIFADAQKEAAAPTDLPDGQLRMITRTDAHSGGKSHHFFGRHCFTRDFTPAKRLAKIVDPRQIALRQMLDGSWLN